MHSMTHQSIFFYVFNSPKKKTPKETQWCLILDVISEGYPSVTSDEHKSVVIIIGVRVCLNELSNSTSYKVWFINLILLTNDGHRVSQNFRHSQASLVRVFFHLYFLLSFWILDTIRFTVSRILSFLGLGDGILFLRPNRVLSLSVLLSLFIWFTPYY